MRNNSEKVQFFLSQRKDRARARELCTYRQPHHQAGKDFLLVGDKRSKFWTQCSWRTRQQYTDSAEEGVSINTQAGSSHQLPDLACHWAIKMGQKKISSWTGTTRRRAVPVSLRVTRSYRTAVTFSAS